MNWNMNNYYGDMNKILFFLIFIFSVSFIFSANAQNIAKGKEYKFSEKPNYALTKGSDDRDLTDGKKKSGDRFWQDKSTVGWNYLQEIRIDLDLDDTYTIDGFAINTVQGQRGNVKFPVRCLVFSSLDNEHFNYHGDIMSSIEDSGNGDYRVQSFSLKKINAKGRYLKFVLTTNGKFLFLDEIEVFGSKANNTRRNNNQLISKSELNDFINNKINESRSIRAQKNYLKSAKNYLGDLFPEINNSDTKVDVDQTIKSTQNQFLPNDIIYTPIRTLGALDDFTLKDVIENRNNSDENVFIDHQNGLYYFSLINNKSQEESIVFQFTNDIHYTVSEILPVVNQNRANIKDALKPVTNNLVTIDPGENKYFVIEMLHDNANDGTLKILASGNNDLIKEFKFSKSVLKSNKQNDKLEVNLWAYLDKPVLKDNVEFAVNDLENAGVDVIVVHSAFIDGYDTRDFSKLKRYLKNFKNLKNKKVLLFHSFTRAEAEFNEKTFLNKAWIEKFRKWYRTLQRELTEIEVRENEIYFYPYDEIKPKDVSNFIDLIKWGKANIPNFKTFVTINNEQSYEAARYADIVQITKPHLNNIQKIDNNNIWMYTATSHSRDLDPYKDYRLMSWYAYYYDLLGVGFWNYCSVASGDDAHYNKVVDGNREYSVIYVDDKQEVLLSIRWLSFQQGLNDYQTLKYYEDLVGKDRIREVVKSVIDNVDKSARADEALAELSKEL